MARRWIIIAGSLAFLLGVLVLFPARVVYHWIAPAEVALAGIEGTLWRGRANHAEFGGIYLRDLSWTTSPLALFAGKASIDFEATPVSGFLEGQVSVGLGGTVAIKNASGSIALSALADIINMPNLDGTATLRLDQLDIKDGWPVAASGTLEVANLLAPNVYSRAAIGGYRAEFFTQGDGLMAQVVDTDGVIDIAATLLLKSDRTFDFSGLVAPKAETAEALRNQMRFLGTPEDGKYPFKLEGSL